MPRRVFFSFHYKADAWRAAQVRNMGVVEGNTPVSDNAWEEVKRGGDEAIRRWIRQQMDGRSCCVVLIGEHTAGRRWINYEIQYAWETGKGVVGVFIHNLKDQDSQTCRKGENPFQQFTLEIDGRVVFLASIVKAYDPPYNVRALEEPSKQVYDYIKRNLSNWVEEAIEIRKQY